MAASRTEDRFDVCSLCDWCSRPRDLTRMWDEMVCEECIARFVREMAPEEFSRPPVAQCTILKSLLEPEVKPNAHIGFDRPSNSYFVRCATCQHPGPSAPTIAEARAEALRDEFVVFGDELVCRICHAGGTTC